MLSFDWNQIATLGLALVALLLAIDAILLRRKLRKMLRGKNDLRLDESIASIDRDIQSLSHFQKEAEDYFRNVEKRLRRSLQALETVKFDAFKGSGLGGTQSFASAFVNEDGDGVVVSSLYSRDRMSVFSKPVSRFTSDVSLSEEEAEALTRARARLSK